MKDKPFALYPDILHDMTIDPLLTQRYGLCAESCPVRGSYVHDYGNNPRHENWFISFPSFPVLGRCVPYAPLPQTNDTLLCAQPTCIPTASVPSHPRQVCGLHRDGTDKFWPLSNPDQYLIDGWRLEGANETMIAARIEVARTAGKSGEAHCDQAVKRQTSVVVNPVTDGPDGVFNSVVTPITLAVGAVQQNGRLVLALGLGGGFVLSLILISLFAFCAPLILTGLMFVLYIALIAVDYIFFVQAHWLSGGLGASTIAALASLHIHVPEEAASVVVDQITDKSWIIGLSQALAILLLAIILCLPCLLCALQESIKHTMIVLREAAQVVRHIPSLLLGPLIALASMAITSVFLVALAVGTVTVKWENEHSSLTDSTNTLSGMQKGLLWGIVFMFLWMFYFLNAKFRTIAAHVVAGWYSRGAQPSLQECLGVEMMKSSYVVCRYHLGSLAKGSFLLAAIALPRIVLQFIEHRSETAKKNPCVKTIIQVLECCLCCAEAILSLGLSYAYTSIAITGTSLCQAAEVSRKLAANNTFLIAMGAFAASVVNFLVSAAVPVLLVLAVAWATKIDDVVFPAVGGAVALISFIIARIAVAVYDACIIALVVCHCAESPVSPRSREEQEQVNTFKTDIELRRQGTRPPSSSSGQLGDGPFVGTTEMQHAGRG
eukprot:TRINITY_DN26790_c0_g1_i1.p1 TRINITY_DN26790_c0_g1~~TRINITY_DN26790_c0_g1_i1.p1  ORF type:complete len:736 (+),score=83.52 TRINITY_DN26790_c0_g1_i1:224-2209(+)